MRDTQKRLRQARDTNREKSSKKLKKGLHMAGLFLDQNSLRPLFAAMRMRKALSLMKPAASAWL